MTRYSAFPTVLVRCATGPTTSYPASRSASDDVEEVVTHLWTDPLLRDSVTVASPVLAARADDVASGRAPRMDARQLDRLERSLVKYAIRLSSRPTPFGLFSVTGTASFGPEPLRLDLGGTDKCVRLGQRFVKRLRHQVEDSSDAYRVVVNRASVVGDDRVTVLVHPRAGDDRGASRKSEREVVAGASRMVSA